MKKKGRKRNTHHHVHAGRLWRDMCCLLFTSMPLFCRFCISNPGSDNKRTAALHRTALQMNSSSEWTSTDRGRWGRCVLRSCTCSHSSRKAMWRNSVLFLFWAWVISAERLRTGTRFNYRLFNKWWQVISVTDLLQVIINNNFRTGTGQDRTTFPLQHGERIRCWWKFDQGILCSSGKLFNY